MSEIRGIFQSDLIISTAIREAFRDLRANPWLVAFIFQSLVDDPLTAREFGKKQVEAAKKWLLNTDIPVFVAQRLDQARFPAITISLIESAEADNTVSDIHYQTTEAVTGEWPALAGPFVPVSWDSSTGRLTLPASISETVDVFPGMKIQDSTGKLHEVLDTEDDLEGLTVAVLAENTSADFKNAYVKSGSPPQLNLESASFRESYLIGAHINGEPWQLTVLHSTLSFLLLRYRETLLEARGFEVSSFSSTDFARNQAIDPEQGWSRYLTLTGKIRQCWPKAKWNVISGVRPEIRIIDSGETEEGLESLWLGEFE